MHLGAPAPLLPSFKKTPEMIQGPTCMVHSPARGSINQPGGEEVLTIQGASQGRATNCHGESGERGDEAVARRWSPGAQRRSPSPMENKPVTCPCFSSSSPLLWPSCWQPPQVTCNESHLPAPSTPRAPAVLGRGWGVGAFIRFWAEALPLRGPLGVPRAGGAPLWSQGWSDLKYLLSGS